MLALSMWLHVWVLCTQAPPATLFNPGPILATQDAADSHPPVMANVESRYLRVTLAALMVALAACSSPGAEPDPDPDPDPPPPRRHAAMMYSPVSRKVLLYGGAPPEGGSALDDLWLWSGTDWSRLAASSGIATLGHSLFFNATDVFLVRDRGEVSRLAGTNWVPVNTDQTPSRVTAGTAYDIVRRRFVRFGGNPISGGSPVSETWEFDGQRWTLVTQSGPSARAGVAMAYDPFREVVVLFGGYDDAFTSLGDTWEWNGQAWTRITSSGPTPRFGATMVFDDVRREMLLFGGKDASGHRNDLWRFGSGSWTLVTTPTAPSPRAEALLAFDYIRGNTVLFGGEGPDDAHGDTWIWNGTSWTSR